MRAIIKGNDQSFVLPTVLDDSGEVVDMDGWTISFQVRVTPSGSAVLDKTASISGTYDADPNVNTQVATVTVADTDTDSITTGLRHYAWKRTNAGSETDLDWGLVPVIDTASA